MKTTKRKYTPKKSKLPYKKRVTKGITTKYSAKKKREIKTLDLTFTDTYPANGEYITDSMNGILFNTKPQMTQNVVRVAQGAGVCNRIGNKIALKSLRIRCGLHLTDKTGNEPQGARFMVIYDRQPNGVYPSTNVILANVTSSNTVTNGNWLSSINPNFYDRFIVLCDKMFIIGGDVGGLVTTQPAEQKGFFIDEFIKLKGLETQFGSNTNGTPIADLNTGALYIVGFGNITNNAETFYMSGQMRLRFYDN